MSITPHRSRKPLHELPLSRGTRTSWHNREYESQSQLLGQYTDGEFYGDPLCQDTVGEFDF